MTLAELVVALLLLAMALVALLGAAAAGQRSLATAAIIERMTLAASGVIDSLAAHPAPAAGSRITDDVTVHWTVAADSLGLSLHLSAAAFDGARAVNLSFEARHAPR